MFAPTFLITFLSFPLVASTKYLFSALFYRMGAQDQSEVLEGRFQPLCRNVTSGHRLLLTRSWSGAFILQVASLCVCLVCRWRLEGKSWSQCLAWSDSSDSSSPPPSLCRPPVLVVFQWRALSPLLLLTRWTLRYVVGHHRKWAHILLCIPPPKSD